MPANHSDTNIVITIQILSAETNFQDIFVTLLRRLTKDETSSLISRRNAMNLIPQTLISQPMKMRITSAMI